MNITKKLYYLNTLNINKNSFLNESIDQKLLDQVIKQADEESANVVPKTHSPEYIYRMTMLSIIGVLFIIYLTTSNEKLKKYSVLGLKIMVPLTILGYFVFFLKFSKSFNIF